MKPSKKKQRKKKKSSCDQTYKKVALKMDQIETRFSIDNDKTAYILSLYKLLWGNPLVQEYAPHYRFFGLPLYKLLGGNNRPLISVPLTFFAFDLDFFAFDLVCHQSIVNLIYYLNNKSNNPDTSATTLLQINVVESMIWTSLSLPILASKYFRKKPETPPLLPIVNDPTTKPINNDPRLFNNNLQRNIKNQNISITNDRRNTAVQQV